MDRVIPGAFEVRAWRKASGPPASGVRVNFHDAAVRDLAPEFNGIESLFVDVPYEPMQGGPPRWDLCRQDLTYLRTEAQVRPVGPGALGPQVEVTDCYTTFGARPGQITVDGVTYRDASGRHGVVVGAHTNVGDVWAQGFGEVHRVSEFT